MELLSLSLAAVDVLDFDLQTVCSPKMMVSASQGEVAVLSLSVQGTALRTRSLMKKIETEMMNPPKTQKPEIVLAG